MAEIRNPFLSKRLRQPTYFSANRGNTTLCMSVSWIVHRHEALQKHVSKVNKNNLDSLLLPGTNEHLLYALSTKLGERNKVLLNLQEHHFAVSKAHDYLGSLIDFFPTLFAGLNLCSRTAHSSYFASGVVKGKDGRWNDFSTAENRALQSLPEEKKRLPQNQRPIWINCWTCFETFASGNFFNLFCLHWF